VHEMRQEVLDLQLTHGAFSLSDTDASDADNEGSSSSSESAVIADGSRSSGEDAAVDEGSRSSGEDAVDEGSRSSSEDSAVDGGSRSSGEGAAVDEGSHSSSEGTAVDGGSHSSGEDSVVLEGSHSSGEDAAVDEGSRSSGEGAAVDEGSRSSGEDAAVELSDEIFSSSSEESDGGLPQSQQPHTGSQTPPLYFPTSPAPHEAVSDYGFNMEGNDHQSDNIYGWYTIEEKVRSSLFNVSDQVANVTSINCLPSPQRKPSLSRPIH